MLPATDAYEPQTARTIQALRTPRACRGCFSTRFVCSDIGSGAHRPALPVDVRRRCLAVIARVDGGGSGDEMQVGRAHEARRGVLVVRAALRRDPEQDVVVRV